MPPSAAAKDDKDAPKRPLSSYNLFFLFERKRIIEGTDQDPAPITREHIRTVAIEHSKKGRRKHRKTHGKISFKDLARTLASRWKDLDKSRKKVFEEEAKALWDEYELKLADYKAKHGGKGPDEVNNHNNNLDSSEDESPSQEQQDLSSSNNTIPQQQQHSMMGPSAAALNLLRRSSMNGGIPGLTGADPATALMQQQILLAAQRAHQQAHQQQPNNNTNNNSIPHHATSSSGITTAQQQQQQQQQQQAMMNNLRNLQQERDMIQRITSMVQAQATRPLLAAGIHPALNSTSSSSSSQQQQHLQALLQQQQALRNGIAAGAGRNGTPGAGPMLDDSSGNNKRGANSSNTSNRENQPDSSNNAKRLKTGPGGEEESSSLSAQSRYRFDRHDPVEVSKRRVQFTIRGQPKWWGTKVQDHLRQVTQELFQASGYSSVPQFSENQLLQVTLIFAFGKEAKNNNKTIHNVGDTDDLSKFVMEAYKGCLFANHGQVLSIQARKKFDIPGGAGYTMVVLEEEVDFSESGTAAV